MGLLAKKDFRSTPYSFLEEFFPKNMVELGLRNIGDMGSTIPSVNLSETEKEYHIDLAAPGMKKEDFKVEIEDKIISIASEKEERIEQTDKKGNYTRKEFNYSSFRRSFHLPDAAEKEKIDAVYRDGILHVTIPKNNDRSSKSKKNIPIH